MTIVCEKVGLERKSYTGILKPTVLCDTVNQAAVIGTPFPTILIFHTNFSGIGGYRPRNPLTRPLSKWTRVLSDSLQIRN